MKRRLANRVRSGWWWVGVAAGVMYFASEIRPPALWLGFCLSLSALVFITHRTNIKRLLAGQESRLTRQE